MDWEIVLFFTALILLSAVVRFWIVPNLFDPVIARVVPHIPGWMLPVLFASAFVFCQWLRGGRRFGASPWVYEFGAGLGLVLGSLLWIAELRYGTRKAAFHPQSPKAVNKTIDDEM